MLFRSHNHHLYTIIICTQSSSVHNHHLYTIIICTQSSSVHNHHMYIIIICTQSSSVHNHHMYIIIICTQSSHDYWNHCTLIYIQTKSTPRLINETDPYLLLKKHCYLSWNVSLSFECRPAPASVKASVVRVRSFTI